MQRQPGELALGELAFGDVGRHADDCEERSGNVVHRGRRHEHLEHSSILATDPQITRPGVAPGDECGHLEHLGLAVDGRHDLLDEATDDLVAGPPVHPRRGLVPEQDPSLPVGADDGLPGGVEQVGLEPDRVLRGAADGDVTMVDDDAAHRRVVEVVGHAELEPQVLAGNGAHPDIGVERLAGSGECVRQHAVHDHMVGLVEKGERHPPIPVDQHGRGGRRRVRLEHHPIRVNDVVALDRVGEHQLVAVGRGRRSALRQDPVGDVAHRRHHGVRLGIASAEQRSGVDLDPLERSTGR